MGTRVWRRIVESVEGVAGPSVLQSGLAQAADRFCVYPANAETKGQEGCGFTDDPVPDEQEAGV